MCSVTIRNETNDYTGKYNLGDPVEVQVGDDNQVIFKGELIGLEPVYKANGENVLVVRAFNRLHRLSRARKSRAPV